MKYQGRVTCALLVLGFMLVAGFPATAGAAEKEIHYAYIAGAQPHNPVEMIMKEKKMLEAEGIKVKWGEYLAGAYIMQHMASGEVDFAVLGIPPIMIARSQGVDVIMLASSNTEGSAVIASPSVKEIKELNGKKVGTPGIGSIQDAMLDMVGKQHNIKMQHVSMKVSDMPLYLQKGEISAFIAWEPVASRAVDLGYGHVIASSHDILPGHQCCAFVVRGELLKKDPELVRKVFQVYMAAFAYYRKNPEEVLDLTAQKTGLTKKVIAMSFKNVQLPYPPYVNVPNVKLQIEGLIQDGKIQQGAITDVSKFIEKANDTSFLNEYFGKKGK